MDKSCRSFFLWTFCSRESTLAWLLVIVTVTLSRLLQKAEGQPNCPTHTHIHTHVSVYLSLRLMKCDRYDRRDPLRNLTEGQVTRCIFPKKTHKNTQASRNTLNRSLYLMASVLGVCMYVCFIGLGFQWLMEMFSHLRYHICSPGTVPLPPSDLRPDDIPVWPASSQSHDEWDDLIYIISWRHWNERKSTWTLDAHLNFVRLFLLLFFGVKKPHLLYSPLKYVKMFI